MTFNTRIILSVILIYAACLRLYGINFDIPHPDDYITVQAAMHFGPSSVELQGYGIYGLYVWPAVPMVFVNIVLFYVYFLLGRFTGFFPDIHAFSVAYLKDPSGFYLIARIAAVAYAIGTVGLLYKIAARLYTRNIAMTAALFLSASFVHSFHSQFIRPDIPSLLIIMMSILACFKLMDSGQTKYYVFAGVLAGLAAAIKFTSGIIVFAIIVSHLFRISGYVTNQPKTRVSAYVPNLIVITGLILIFAGLLAQLGFPVDIATFTFSEDGLLNSKIIDLISGILTFSIIGGVMIVFFGFAVRSYSFVRDALHSFFHDRKIIIAAIAAIVSFAVFDPIFFLDIKNQIRIFMTDANYFGRPEDSWFVGVGSLGFIGNLWWYLKEPVFWGAGGIITLLSAPGIVIGIKRKKRTEYIFCIYFLFYLVLISFGRMRWERYAVTLMPFVALYAAVALYGVIGWISGGKLERSRLLAAGLLSVAIVIPNTYDILRYDYLLTRKDTRTIASEWVQMNIPAGSRIGQDAYTGTLPAEKYDITSKFSLGDKPLKYYIDSGYDYLIVSDTQYKRFIKEPDRFPQYAKFYNNLLSRGWLDQEIKPDSDLWPPPEQRFEKYHIHVSPLIRVYKINKKVRRIS